MVKGALDVWVVDDDESVRWVLEQALKQAGMVPRGFATAETFFAGLERATPDVLITDIKMPDVDGLEIIERLSETHPDLPAIVITAHSDLDSAVSAYQSGAFEYLPKPFDIDQAIELVERAARQRAKNGVEGGVRREKPTIIGKAPAMQEVFKSIGRLSRSSMTVLITGESGTGKELVARALHDNSPRASEPFVALNTSAIAAELLESELFGHEKGAFTGATERRIGRFEQADGGTLFLDEIGEMPAQLQAKLLRVLEEGKIRPLGGSEEIEIDARIVAATNHDIEHEVKAGHWREDLYYRLETLALEVPPLRRRTADDRIALAAHFLAVLAAERDLPRLRLSEEALSAVQAYSFPGNVRELANALTRAATFCEGATIAARHLPARMRRERPLHDPAGEDPLRLHEDPPPTLAQVEARYIRWILATTGQNKKRSAEILDVGRRTLYRKLEDPS